jgi:hypothetical protein
MSLTISNVEKISDTVKSGGPVPATYPDFWNWIGCYSEGVNGPGEWGDVDGITFIIDGCETVATKPSTWGSVKAMYRK